MPADLLSEVASTKDNGSRASLKAAVLLLFSSTEPWSSAASERHRFEIQPWQAKSGYWYVRRRGNFRLIEPIKPIQQSYFVPSSVLGDAALTCRAVDLLKRFCLAGPKMEEELLDAEG